MLEQWFSKLFFMSSHFKPKHCQFFPKKNHKRCTQKFHITYCEETIDDYEPNTL